MTDQQETEPVDVAWVEKHKQAVVANRRNCATAWIRNPTTSGKHIGLKRICVQPSSFSQAAGLGKRHVEFYHPTQESAVLDRLVRRFNVRQVYRQRPNSRRFEKAEVLSAARTLRGDLSGRPLVLPQSIAVPNIGYVLRVVTLLKWLCGISHEGRTNVTEFVNRLRRDTEATRTALAMVEAVHQHIQDLLDDDPGDRDPQLLPLLDEAGRHADVLVRVLREMTRRES